MRKTNKVNYGTFRSFVHESFKDWYFAQGLPTAEDDRRDMVSAGRRLGLNVESLHEYNDFGPVYAVQFFALGQKAFKGLGLGPNPSKAEFEAAVQEVSDETHSLKFMSLHRAGTSRKWSASGSKDGWWYRLNYEFKGVI